MPRKADPDHVLDLDRGSGSTGSKLAEPLSPDDARDRALEREGFEELDAVVEQSRGPGLTRLAKDSQRIYPRETNQPLGRAVMLRRLPERGSVRQPVNGYQRKVRSKVRREVDAAMPLTQYGARVRLLNDPEMWSRVNDRLSETAGDVQALSDRDAADARRVDRAIQAYEAQNDRGHVVYFNVELPSFINSSNAEAYLRRRLRRGDQVTFDRFTPATHQMHETAATKPDPHGRVVIVEMQTRRGAYLGRSDSSDLTEHLLPRALPAEVVGFDRASFTDRTGRSDERLVIQMRDIPTESDRKE